VTDRPNAEHAERAAEVLDDAFRADEVHASDDAGDAIAGFLARRGLVVEEAATVEGLRELVRLLVGGDPRSADFLTLTLEEKWVVELANPDGGTTVTTPLADYRPDLARLLSETLEAQGDPEEPNS
jgi:hypothetical protein